MFTGLIVYRENVYVYGFLIYRVSHYRLLVLRITGQINDNDKEFNGIGILKGNPIRYIRKTCIIYRAYLISFVR